MASLPKILYFVLGETASPSQILEAKSIPANVQMRNAYEVGGEDNLESADGVMGAVPESYAHYPSGEDAVAEYKRQLDESRKELESQLEPTTVPEPKVSKKSKKSDEKPVWGKKGE